MSKSYQNKISLQEKHSLADLSPLALALLKIISSYKYCYLSQSTLAEKLGCSRKHINVTIKKLCTWGFLFKKEREWNTCHYWLPEWMRNERIRLNCLWKLVAFVSLSLLMPYTSAQTRPVTQYGAKEFNLLKTQSPSYHYPSTSRQSTEPLRTHARVRVGGGSEKQGTVMQAPDFVTPELRIATKLLNLTKWGQIHLTPYPQAALAHANTATRNTKSAKIDLFRWYVSICVKYCRESQIEPNWGVISKLGSKHGMPNEPRLVLEKKQESTTFNDSTNSTPQSAPEKASWGGHTNWQDKYSLQVIAKLKEERALAKVAHEAKFTPEERAAKLAMAREWLAGILPEPTADNLSTVSRQLDFTLGEEHD